MFCFMKKNVNEVAAFKPRWADLKQHNQKLHLENEAWSWWSTWPSSNSKSLSEKSLGPSNNPYEHPAPFGWYARTLQSATLAVRLGKAVRLDMRTRSLSGSTRQSNTKSLRIEASYLTNTRSKKLKGLLQWYNSLLKSQKSNKEPVSKFLYKFNHNSLIHSDLLRNCYWYMRYH
jgi:hypothetical protein